MTILAAIIAAVYLAIAIGFCVFIYSAGVIFKPKDLFTCLVWPVMLLRAFRELITND